MLKNYQLFKESKTVLVKRPWIFEGDFKVSYDMVFNGKLIKDLIPDQINGSFNCSYRKLTSLEGCPSKVSEHFLCEHNQLISLEGCLSKINKTFDCSNNKLTSLKGCPKEVGGGFYCDFNKLTSLEGCPKKIKGSLYCNDNELTTLKGGPNIVTKSFYCHFNKLTSLEGCSVIMFNDIMCNDNIVDLTIEREFIKSDKYSNQETYWQDLLQYMLDEKIDLNKVKGWPDEFIETLDDQYKNMFKSFKGTKKFNL